MYLQPGEVFEHLHSDRSMTTLVEGRVVLEMNGTAAELEPGRPTPVDSEIAHRLVNIGTSVAAVRCVHVMVKR
jgi:uncharacterized cupin superfamily protein